MKEHRRGVEREKNPHLSNVGKINFRCVNATLRSHNPLHQSKESGRIIQREGGKEKERERGGRERDRERERKPREREKNRNISIINSELAQNDGALVASSKAR